MSGGRPLQRGHGTYPHPLSTGNHELNRRSSSTYGNGNNYTTSPLSVTTPTARPADMISRKRSIASATRGNSPPIPHKRNNRPDINGAKDVARGSPQDRHKDVYSRREPPARPFSESGVSTRNGGIDNRSPINASPVLHSGSGASTPVQVAPTAPPMTPGALPQAAPSAVYKAKAPAPIRSLLTTIAYEATSRQAALAADRLEQQRAGSWSTTLSTVQQMQKRKVDIAQKLAEDSARKAIAHAQVGQSAISATLGNNISSAKSNENIVEGSSENAEIKAHNNQAEVKALQICIKQLQTKQSSYDEQAKKQYATQKSVADLQTAIEQQKQSLDDYIAMEINRQFTESKEVLDKYLETQMQQRTHDLKVALEEHIDAEVERRSGDSHKSLATTVASQVQSKIGQEVPILKQAIKRELFTEIDQKITAEIGATEKRIHSETAKSQSNTLSKMHSLEHRLSQLETTNKLINGKDASLQTQIKSIQAKITALDTSIIKGEAVEKLLGDQELRITKAMDAKLGDFIHSDTKTDLNLAKEEIHKIKDALKVLQSRGSAPSNSGIQLPQNMEARMATCENRLTGVETNVKSLNDDLIESDARLQGTENGMNALTHGINGIVTNTFIKEFRPLQESVDQRFAEVSKKLQKASDNVEKVITKTVPELLQQQTSLQQSTASAGAAIEAFGIELEKAKIDVGHAKILAQDASGRLEINTNSLQSLTERYENINTEELHHRMVNEILAKYPNTQGMIDRLNALEHAWNPLVTRTSKLEAESMHLSNYVQSLSQGIGDQLQRLGSDLNNGIAKDRNNQETLEKLEAESAQLSNNMQSLSQGINDQLQKLGNELNDNLTKKLNDQEALKKLEAESARLSNNMQSLSKGIDDQLQKLGNELNHSITKERNEREILKKNLEDKFEPRVEATMRHSARLFQVVRDINENLPVPLPRLEDFLSETDG